MIMIIKNIIRRPIAVTMSLIAIVVLGIVAIGYLPVSLMPDIDIPQITLQLSNPGASVREIDNTLKPIKAQLMQVEGLQTITSEARSDAGTIFMTFEPGSNIDIIFIEVNEKLDRSLPKDMERPKILKASATDIPAFYLNLTARNSHPQGDGKLPEAGTRFAELSSFARDVVTKRLEQLPQTAMVDISGVVTPELLCIPDQKKLTSMGADIGLLESAIKGSNVTLGALSIRDGIYRYNIHFDSQILTKKDIENIYINHNGRLYRFKELCDVVERPAKRSGLVRNGRDNAVTMAIIKQNDAKMEDLQESISQLVQNLEKEYPDVGFEITRDQTKLLTYSIDNLESNLWLGALLACLVIFLFMKDLRSPVLITITIPLSLILTLLTFHLLGITINIISLSGLVLGMGMMVDNSIIVIDNISQCWQRGLPLREAIGTAVKEVFTPMLSAVLTTCSVFIPLIFLSGVAGSLFYDQAMAVSIALLASLLVAVLVIPVYYYQMYKKLDSHTSNRFLSKYFSFNYYRPYELMLKWFMHHRILVISLFFAVLPATVLLYRVVEKNRLPDISHDDTILTIDWNSGITLEENDRRVGELLAVVAGDIEQSTSMVGVQQFLLSHTKEITPSESVVYIKTKDEATLEKVKNEIIRYSKGKYPQGVIGFHVSGNIFDMIFAENEPKLVIQLQSNNGNSPEVVAVSGVLERIRKELPGLYIAPPVMERNIRYVANVEAMAMYHVTYGDIYGKLKNIVSQNVLFKINQGGYSVPVTTGEELAGSNDILSGKVRNRQGVEIPLSLLIKETKGEDFKKLYSGAGGDYYPIFVEAADKDIKHIQATVENIVKEDGNFFVTFTGAYFSSRAMIWELIIILAVAVSLLYFILAAQFESIVQPLIILSELVFDIFFVLLGLWLFGESLNLMSLIGIVVMSGIIINDSILKVDTINRLRHEGMSLTRAVMTGGHKRLKPIIMTSLTTILAIAPFLNHSDMGSDLQYPLSLSIIIGMSVGTLVSLFFIPVAYYTLYKKGTNDRKRK